jgi:hypothetical protein
VDWIEESRRVWAERFDKLGTHLRDLQSGSHPRNGEDDE